jgi:hypothetical protein
MHRDLTPQPVRRSFSDRASARFFYLVDAIARAHEPTQSQLDALESSYQSTGEYLVASPEFRGLLIEVHGHGSRQLGTLIRPIDPAREGFDVDSIIRLNGAALHVYEQPAGPKRLLADLATVMGRYATKHGLSVQRWERCVTLEYSGGMRADFAPVIDDPMIAHPLGDTHGRIPDRQLQIYDGTNPRGYTLAFNRAAAISPVFTSALNFAEAMKSMDSASVAPLPSADEVFDRLLCRLVQLLKLNRNVAFGSPSTGQDASPTSVFLTTLAAQAYASQAPLPHNSPLELLLDVVDALPNHFERRRRPDGSEEWLLQNPSAPFDNLAAGMNTVARQQGFCWWIGRLSKQLHVILDAIENCRGLDVLVAALEAAFGERAGRAVQEEQSRGRQVARQVGRVALIPAVGAPVNVAARQHTFFGGL